MKHTILHMFIPLIITTSMGSPIDSNIFKNSLFGPYQFVLKQHYNCNPNQNNKIQYNMYVSRKNNATFLYGNTTNVIPFDDTLSLEIKVAVKDSFDIWKENAFVQTSPNACSTLKKLFGKVWSGVIRGYGFPTVNCPLPVGAYISPGFDVSIFKNSNIPKMVLYGTYKIKIWYARKNEIFGCQTFIADAKRL